MYYFILFPYLPFFLFFIYCETYLSQLKITGDLFSDTQQQVSELMIHRNATHQKLYSKRFLCIADSPRLIPISCVKDVMSTREHNYRLLNLMEIVQVRVRGQDSEP